jgi:hypothetical protein
MEKELNREKKWLESERQPYIAIAQIFSPLLLLLLLLLLHLCPLLCSVFTIMYLKQTVFVWYIMLQLFCFYRLCYTQCYFDREMCFVL